MQLKRGIIFFAILVLVFSMFSVNARIMHLSNDVRVLIDGEGRTLSSAVSGGFLIGQRDSGDPQFISNPGHSSNEIWISIDGSEMTLREGISSPGGLCGSMSIDSYSSLNIPPVFHLATEINLSSGKTLQQAINDGDFCISCTPGQTQIIDCSSLNTPCRTYHDGILTDTCSPTGEWTNPDCTSYTNIARGTNCNSQGTSACDGEGNCLGWSGTGCGGCPFGSANIGTCNRNTRNCYVPAGYQSRHDWITGSSFSWSPWNAGPGYPPCYRCTFCAFAICFNFENVDWQIKPAPF